MLRAFFRQQWPRLVDGIRWIWNQSASAYEIFCGFFLLLCEFDLFAIAFLNQEALANWYRWIWTYVWAIVPAYRLPVRPLPVGLFWEMWTIPLVLVALPRVGIFLIKKGLVEIIAWKQDSEQRLAYIIQRERTLISYLYVIAQFENAQRHYWKRRKAAEENARMFSPTTQTTISKYAGLFSFLYVTFSTYLSLSPWIPEQHVVEGSLATTALVSATEQRITTHSSHISNETSVRVEIFLFGTVRVRLGGADAREWVIEKPRLAVLLAYLAMHTRGQTIRSETIVTYVYDEEESEEKDAKQLYYLLHNDVGELRTLLKGLFQQAGLPYQDPITIVGRGKKARWSLSESYAIVDIIRLETVARQLADAKRQAPADTQALRGTYEAALQAYGEGFLKQLGREGYAGSWAEKQYKNYEVMHHQLLWDAAEYEHALGENATTEPQQDRYKRSAQLYRTYAFVTMPGLASERALRHSMTIAGNMGEKQLADGTYCEYIEKLKRTFSRKLMDPRTTKTWEEVVGQ